MAQSTSFTSSTACMLYPVLIDPAALLLFTALPLCACVCVSAFLKLINNQPIGQKMVPQKSMPSHLSISEFSSCLNSIKYLALNNPGCVEGKESC